MADPIIITWDWREQIDLECLVDAVNGTWDSGPKVYAIDTGSDQYALVVCEGTMSQNDANQVWEDWDGES